jgi:hypothetical protein
MTEKVHLAFIILAPGGGSSSAHSSEGFALTTATVATIDAVFSLSAICRGRT